MAFDLIPSNFLTFPRFPSFIDEDEDWAASSHPSGVSIFEDEKKIYVEASLPGIDEKNIETTFDRGILWIKGEKKIEEQDKKQKYYRRAASSFSYRVAVPGDIDLSADPEATCKNGVMTVSFLKSPSSQPKKISIKTKK